MTIASEITDLQTNLANAKAAVTAKGGTTGNTGLAGLATEIASIPSGGVGYTGTPYGKVTIVTGYGVEWSLGSWYGCTVTIVDKDMWDKYYSTPIYDGGLGYPKVDASNPGGFVSATVQDMGGFGDIALQSADSQTVNFQWDLNDPSSLSSQIGLEVVFEEGETQGGFDMMGQFSIDTSSATADITIPDLTTYTNFDTSDYVVSINGLELPREAIVSFEFGNSVTSVPNKFLILCTNLSSVDFTYATSLTSIGDRFLESTGYNDNLTLPTSLTTIGNNFLSSSTSFNKPLTIPSNVTTIGNGFLSSCFSFNKPLTIPSSVTTIGDNFLVNALSFNSVVTLPEGLLSIGDGFLSGCGAFNQPLTLPSTLTHIGKSFLSNMVAMCSRVDVGSLLPSIVDAPASGVDQTLSTRSNTSAAYTQGIPLKASNISVFTDWLTRFPNGEWTVNVGKVYRNLTLDPSIFG